MEKYNFLIKLSKKLVMVLVVFVCFIIINENSKKYDIVNVNNINNVNLSKAITSDLLTKEDAVLGSFVGTMSAYGFDCVGCGGTTGCRPYQYVGNGNIYFTDVTYGTLRIVAADMSVPCGTVVKIDSTKSDELIYAIVLDRGGAIGFDKKVQLDLLMASESETIQHGLAYNTKVDILRYGW